MLSEGSPSLPFWYSIMAFPIVLLIVIVSRPVISKSTIYDFTIKASCEITVHHGFEYCGLIARHSSS
jgi:hypothetical protein